MKTFKIKPLDFWSWEIVEKIGKFRPNNSVYGNIIFQYNFPNYSQIGNERQTFTMQVTKYSDTEYHLNCFGWKEHAYKTFKFTANGYQEACEYIEYERLDILEKLGILEEK